MSRFDDVAAHLEAAVFDFHGDIAQYQPALGEPRDCQVILDQDVEVFDPMDVSSVIHRDEAEFLNSEGYPKKGESFVLAGETWEVGQLLKQTLETTRVIVFPR